jgi:hypothetical protein
MNLDYVTSRIKSYNRLLMIKYLIRNVKSYVHYPNKKIVYLSMQLLFQFLIVRGIKEKRESSRTFTNEKKKRKSVIPTIQQMFNYTTHDSS